MGSSAAVRDVTLNRAGLMAKVKKKGKKIEKVVGQLQLKASSFPNEEEEKIEKQKSKKYMWKKMMISIMPCGNFWIRVGPEALLDRNPCILRWTPSGLGVRSEPADLEFDVGTYSELETELGELEGQGQKVIQNRMDPSVPSSTQGSGLIDTTKAVASLIDSLSNLPTHPPSIYVDLEGVKLSREGSVSIIQIFILPTSTTHLIDIHTLGASAFNTPASSGTGQTLQGILESPSIPKAFFDVRKDSDALYSHFGIDLAGIHDIQLMELATRTFSKQYLSGLAKCMENDLFPTMTYTEKRHWREVKEAGIRLFSSERGGSYESTVHCLESSTCKSH
ncbi:hypothetical protein R1flu_007891 [Riccia fluitans]|uniref:3'-5' exonuclease domain-containing protein n=1 Tax=Riccia fluitans TaxID=41844 RepID=A0ABD1Z4A7_9MARC